MFKPRTKETFADLGSFMRRWMSNPENVVAFKRWDSLLSVMMADVSLIVFQEFTQAEAINNALKCVRYKFKELNVDPFEIEKDVRSSLRKNPGMYLSAATLTLLAVRYGADFLSCASLVSPLTGVSPLILASLLIVRSVMSEFLLSGNQFSSVLALAKKLKGQVKEASASQVAK
jgi:hypothetical protein